jgi:hypothetical protein
MKLKDTHKRKPLAEANAPKCSQSKKIALYSGAL